LGCVVAIAIVGLQSNRLGSESKSNAYPFWAHGIVREFLSKFQRNRRSQHIVSDTIVLLVSFGDHPGVPLPHSQHSACKTQNPDIWSAHLLHPPLSSLSPLLPQPKGPASHLKPLTAYLRICASRRISSTKHTVVLSFCGEDLRDRQGHSPRRA
jgi:hypothetical protein